MMALTPNPSPRGRGEVDLLPSPSGRGVGGEGRNCIKQLHCRSTGQLGRQLDAC